MLQNKTGQSDYHRAFEGGRNYSEQEGRMYLDGDNLFAWQNGGTFCPKLREMEWTGGNMFVGVKEQEGKRSALCRQTSQERRVAIVEC